MSISVRRVLSALTLLGFIAVPVGSLLAQSNWQQQQQWQRQQEMQRQQQMQQEQQRRQMQEQQRRQLQDQQRQQMQEQQRRQMQEQQRQQMQTQQRQQMQTKQQAQQRQQQQTAQQQRQQMQKQGTLGKDGKPTGVVVSGGVAKMARPLTPAEIQRGFTGRVTADGRALIKYQGRIFVVPASRVSGLSARLAKQQAQRRPSLWTGEQRALINEKTKALAVSGGSGRGPGSTGGPANDSSMAANRIAFATFFKSSGKSEGDLFRHSRGWDYSKPIKRQLIKAGTELCQWQIPGGHKGSYFAPCGSTPSSLGIADSASSGSEMIARKAEHRYTVKQDIEGLQGTAAKVADDWSIKGRRVETEGGGQQILLKSTDLEHLEEKKNE